METTAGAAPRLDARSERTVVASLSAIALILGLISLGRPEFFPDESYTWSTVNRSFPAMLGILVHKEAFQVLHSVLLWPVNAISDSSFALRLPSVLFFAATVPAVWALARRLFDERAALVAALLLAINAFALQYAQEARSYTLAMMFAAYAGAALARDVIDPTPWSRRAWMACAIAAVWAHGMAVFAITAMIASLLVLPRERLVGRRFLRDAVIVGVLVAPVIIAPELQLNRAEAFPSGDHPSLATLRLVTWAMAGRSAFALVPYAVGGLVAVLAALRAARTKGRSVDTWRFAMPLLWLLFPPAFLISYSFVSQVWVERYAIPSLGALVVLVAYGLTRINATRALAAVLAVSVAAGGYGVVRWYMHPGLSSFNDVLSAIEARGASGDAVALATDRSRVPLEFALRHSSLRRRLVPVFPPEPWGKFHTGMQEGLALPEASVGELRAKYDRVWVIAGFYDPDPQISHSLRLLRDAGYRLDFSHTYGGPIALYLFQRR